MKPCRVCNQLLPTSSFSKGKATCHKCLYQQRKARESGHSRERRANRRKQQTASQIRYRGKNPDYRKRQKEYQRRRERNTLKSEIRRLVWVAIREGHLVRPSVCSLQNENCSGQIEAHHLDYNKPLDVVWLCRNHHLAWHRIFLAAEIQI